MTQVGGTFVNQSKRIVIVNGQTYKFPRGMKGNNISTVNNKVYIDGLELKDGEWKRTIKALYHKFF